MLESNLTSEFHLSDFKNILTKLKSANKKTELLNQKPEKPVKKELITPTNFEFSPGLAYMIVVGENPISPVDFVQNAIMFGTILDIEISTFREVLGKEEKINLKNIDPFPYKKTDNLNTEKDYSLDKDTAVKIQSLAYKYGFEGNSQEWINRSISLLRMADGLDLKYRVWTDIYPFDMQYVKSQYKAYGWNTPRVIPTSSHMQLIVNTKK